MFFSFIFPHPLCFFLKILFVFIWRIIALQYCVGFCHVSAWIGHRYTYVPSLLNLPSTPQLHPTPLAVTEHQIWAPCIIRVNCLISKTFGRFPNIFLLFSFKLILYGLQWFIIIVLCYLLNHIGKRSYKSKIDEYRLLYLHMQFPLLIFLISSCWFELQSNVLSFQAEGLPLTFPLGRAGGKEHSQLFVWLGMACFLLHFGRIFLLDIEFLIDGSFFSSILEYVNSKISLQFFFMLHIYLYLSFLKKLFSWFSFGFLYMVSFNVLKHIWNN